MNLYLANQEVNHIKLHNLHWYVKGSSFFTLHPKLEELYEQSAQIMDEVAERLLSLDQAPVANLKAALDMATVKELNDVPIKSEEAVKTLVADVDKWIEDTKELVDLAEKAEDGATADMFNEYLAEYQKTRWMLKSYLG